MAYNKKDSTNKALLVLTERKTRREIIILISSRKAETIVKAPDVLERKIGAVNFRKIFKTITVDNGSEFSAAGEMKRSVVNKTIPRIKVYLYYPYSPWECGSDENANIMTRQEHPKGTNFEKVSARQTAGTKQRVNNYPRKILGYIDSEAALRICLWGMGLSMQAVWDIQEKGGNWRRYEEHNKGKRGLPTKGTDGGHIVMSKLDKTKGENLYAINA